MSRLVVGQYNWCTFWNVTDIKEDNHVDMVVDYVVGMVTCLLVETGMGMVIGTVIWMIVCMVIGIIP